MQCHRIEELLELLQQEGGSSAGGMVSATA